MSSVSVPLSPLSPLPAASRPRRQEVARTIDPSDSDIYIDALFGPMYRRFERILKGHFTGAKVVESRSPVSSRSRANSSLRSRVNGLRFLLYVFWTGALGVRTDGKRPFLFCFFLGGRKRQEGGGCFFLLYFRLIDESFCELPDREEGLFVGNHLAGVLCARGLFDQGDLAIICNYSGVQLHRPFRQHMLVGPQKFICQRR